MNLYLFHLHESLFMMLFICPFPVNVASCAQKNMEERKDKSSVQSQQCHSDLVGTVSAFTYKFYVTIQLFSEN